MTDTLRDLLREVKEKGLIYWEPNTTRGHERKAEMISRIDLALAAAPQPAPVDDYHNDPSTDDRWNAGCDYAMTALCKLLCINTDDVTWDAATEELEGDVLAVLGNILTVRFGDDWRKAAPQPSPVEREALVEVIREINDDWIASDSRPSSRPEFIADALLARPSQAGDARVARLIEAVRGLLHYEIAHVGPYAVLRVAEVRAALAAMDTPKGGGDE